MTALGAALRLFRLADQSVWHDEFLALCHFRAPDLSRHLALMDLYMPANMKSPLYYILQYGIARHVTDSLFGLRLMAVMFGVLSIPMLFLLVRRLFGGRPALFAALLLALSPQHVWYSQEVRTYALSTFLAILSFYCFLRAVEGGGRRWWLASLLVNALLPWTHLMFSLTAFGEGCFLLWWWRRSPGRVIGWALAQFALMIPMVVSLFPLPFAQDAASPTGLFETLTAFFAVDSVNLYGDFLPSWKAVPSATPSWTGPLLALRTPADLLLGAFFAATLVCAAAGMARGGGMRRGLAYALCLWLAPVALLTALNLATQRPFLSSMYHMFGVAGAYGAAGWMVCAVRRTSLRRALAGAAAVLYLFNLSLLLPFVTRTDWKGLADHVVRQKGPSDLVVNLEFYGPNSPVEYYRETIGLPIVRRSTVTGVCAAAAEALSAPGAGDVPRQVWIVYRALFRERFLSGEKTAEEVRKRLAPCGIGVEETLFPGQYNVTLLKASRLPGRIPSPFAGVSSADDAGHAALLGELGLTFARPEDRESALSVLREEVGFVRPDLPSIVWGPCALDLVIAGRPDLAEAVARWQIGRVPKAAPLHFALGVALFAQGRVEEAGESFETAYRHQPSLRLLTAPLVGHLLRGDRPAARAELERMRPWGWAYYLPVFDYLLKDAGPQS